MPLCGPLTRKSRMCRISGLAVIIEGLGFMYYTTSKESRTHIINNVSDTSQLEFLEEVWLKSFGSIMFTVINFNNP